MARLVHVCRLSGADSSRTHLLGGEPVPCGRSSLRLLATEYRDGGELLTGGGHHRPPPTSPEPHRLAVLYHRPFRGHTRLLCRVRYRHIACGAGLVAECVTGW